MRATFRAVSWLAALTVVLPVLRDGINCQFTAQWESHARQRFQAQPDYQGRG